MMMALVLAVVGCLSSLLDGYVLSRLWTWFVVPTFGVPSLPISAGFGLVLLMLLVSKSLRKIDLESTPETTLVPAARRLVISMFLALALLGEGAIAHWASR